MYYSPSIILKNDIRKLTDLFCAFYEILFNACHLQAVRQRFPYFTSCHLSVDDTAHFLTKLYERSRSSFLPVVSEKMKKECGRERERE